MTSSLVELTAGIVSSHAVGTEMSSDELIQEINRVFAALKKLETEGTALETASAPGAPALTMKKAFQNDQVGCLVCGKTGFKTLTRHLKQAHDLKPGQYRRQFNIPSSQSLTAKNKTAAKGKPAAVVAKPVKTAPVKPAKTAKAAKPVMPAKPAKPAKTAKPAKPAKPAKVKTPKAKA